MRETERDKGKWKSNLIALLMNFERVFIDVITD
jgi:hypothetical protein